MVFEPKKQSISWKPIIYPFVRVIFNSSPIVVCLFSSGSLHADSKVGIYACDPAAYTDPDYKDLFNLVIQDYHAGDPSGCVKHPEPSFGTDAEIDSLGDLDPTGQFVVSTRVRVARSHKGMPFPPAAKKEVLYNNIHSFHISSC